MSKEMMDEMVSILHSLRMLSLHVVKCIIDWRKQLVCNFLLGQNLAHRNSVNSSGASFNPMDFSNNKFKTIPFMYEEQNYLLKM
jgi:hypothetical protein